MKTITIEGQLRTEFGKTATRQLRSQEHGAWCNLRGCTRRLIFLLLLRLLKH